MSSIITAQALRRSLGVFIFLAFATGASAADYYKPDSGKGPAVLLFSGKDGVRPYRWYAMDVAKLGYTVIVVHGLDIWVQESDGAANFRKVLMDSQRDPRVVPGKVAVIGFSAGAGGALLHASPLVDSIASVIAYYPTVTRFSNIGEAGARVAVPTLVLAGERDTFNSCCLIESQREFDAAAQGAKAPFELVIYPNSGHAFNMSEYPSFYRPADSGDAWERTKALLAKTHPIN